MNTGSDWRPSRIGRPASIGRGWGGPNQALPPGNSPRRGGGAGSPAGFSRGSGDISRGRHLPIAAQSPGQHNGYQNNGGQMPRGGGKGNDRDSNCQLARRPRGSSHHNRAQMAAPSGCFAVIYIGYATENDKRTAGVIVARLLDELRAAGRPVNDEPDLDITADSLQSAIDQYTARPNTLPPLDYTIIFESAPSTTKSATAATFQKQFGYQTRYFTMSTYSLAQAMTNPNKIDAFCEQFRNACNIRDIHSNSQSQASKQAAFKQGKAISAQDLQTLYNQTQAETNGQCAVLGVIPLLIEGPLLARMRLCKTCDNPNINKQLLYLAQLLVNFMENKLLVADFISEVLECGFIEHYTTTYIDEMELMLTRADDQSAAKEASESVQYVIVLIIEALKMSPYHAAGFLKGSMAILRNLCDQPFVRENLQFWTPQMADAYGQLMEARQQQIMLTAAPAKPPRVSAAQSAMDKLSETVLPDFREISIEPSVLELKSPSEPPLQPNKAKGTYVDSEHYLNVQFHLLREDFVAPLREAIQEHLLTANLPKAQRPKKGHQHLTIVYREVQLLVPKFVQKKGMFVRELEFTVGRHIKFMKRLLYGSLVALSDDDFKSRILLATIEDRDDLMQVDNAHGKTRTVRLGVSVSSSEQLNVNSRYVMVESPAYFEAYKHVLMGLKRMPRAQPIPYEKYLVRCQTSMERPKYQRRSPGMDLSCLMQPKPGLAQRQLLAKGRVADLINDSQWPSADDLGVDNSQLAALRLALRSELTVIQGPPGTGKTFIGYKLTQVLLENKAAWNPDGKHPILVVCFTNHALDQFLEGCLKFTQKVIRVGSRCKNELLQRFNLSEVRRDRGSLQQLPHDLRHAYSECWQQRKDIEEQLKRASNVSREAESSQLMHPAALAELMPLHVRAHLHDEKTMCDWLKPLKPLMPVESIRFVMWQFRDQNGNGVCDEHTAKLAVCLALRDNNNELQLAHMLLFEPGFGQSMVDENVLQIVHKWPTLMELETLTDTLLMMLKESGSAFTKCSAQQLEHVLLYFDCDLPAALNVLLPQQFDQARQAHLRAQPNAARAQQPAPTLIEPDEEEEEVDESPAVSNMMRVIDAAANEDRSESDCKGILLGDDELATAIDSEQEVHAIAHTARHNPTIHVRLDHGIFMSLGAPESSVAENEWQQQKPRNKGNKQNVQDVSTMDLFTLLIMAALPMDDVRYNQLGAQFNHNQLELPSRWALYKRWVQQYRQQLQVYIHQKEAAYVLQRARQRTVQQLSDLHTLATAHVIGMTTTGAANYQQSLQRLQPKIVIMEEAAEVLEAHLVASLNDACEQVILIGDHKQLRPNPQVYKLAKKFNLDVSLFERLINNKLPYETLSAQHRMRPEMSGTLIKRFYDTLTDHESTHKLPQVNGMNKSMLFITHNELEIDETDSKSHANKHEAAWACELSAHLIKQDYEGGRITILCAYLAQMFEVKKQLQKYSNSIEQVNNILVTVVDNYQGEENDIVILSLVRSNKNGKIGFLNVPNRVCVALSRARHGIFILGNLDFLVEHCVLWKEIADSLNEQGSVQRGVSVSCALHNKQQFITSPDEFQKFAPEGGCMEMCDHRLSCGHRCRKRCHAYDPEHKKAKCLEQCQKKCEAGHNCKNKCYQCVPSCAPCRVSVEKGLPCGHVSELACHVRVDEARCQVQCNKTLGCGHKCKLPCYMPCEKSQCRVKVQVQKNLCGHEITVPCNEQQSLDHVPCNFKMTKTWPFCGHKCETQCHVDVYEVACPQPCAQPLPDCEHLCSGTCGTCKQGRLHMKCKEDCRRVLVCGHGCTHKCGGTGCPPCDKACETKCAHSKCVTKYAKQSGKHRICGEPCPPCEEPCVWNCKHHQCALKCNEPCTRPVCNERCATQLECGEGHMCAGVCNGLHSLDNCPTITINDDKKKKKVFLCALCHPEKWTELTEIFLGNEDEENAAFIQLEDCGCILECTGLDGYVQSKADDTNGEIVQLKCPRCQVPLRSGRRFGAMLKQRIIDIEQVKNKIIGSNSVQLQMERKRLCTEIKKIIDSPAMQTNHAMDTVPNEYGRRMHRAPVQKHNSDRVRALMNALNQLYVVAERRAAAQLTASLLAQWKTVFDLLLRCQQARAFDSRVYSAPDCEQRATVHTEHFQHLQLSQAKWSAHTPRLFSVWSEFTNLRKLSAPQSVVRDLTWLMNWMVTQQLQMSNSQMQQINQILNQLECLSVLSGACAKNVLTAEDIKHEQKQPLRDLLKPLYSADMFSPDKQTKVKTDMEAFMRTLDQPLSPLQLRQIAKAVGFEGVGHWYKCGNCKEMYAIGECGGAMEKARCAKCKAEIGGTGHLLNRTNTRADDVMLGRNMY